MPSDLARVFNERASSGKAAFSVSTKTRANSDNDDDDDGDVASSLSQNGTRIARIPRPSVSDDERLMQKLIRFGPSKRRSKHSAQFSQYASSFCSRADLLKKKSDELRCAEV